MIVRWGEENPGLIAGAQSGQAEDGNNAHLQVLGWCGLDLSDGKIFTTMEWLMVFVKVPL